MGVFSLESKPSGPKMLTQIAVQGIKETAKIFPHGNAKVLSKSYELTIAMNVTIKLRFQSQWPVNASCIFSTTTS